jgi:hypothetical protein
MPHPCHWIGMRLITTFVELHVVARRSRTWTGRTHAASGKLMLIHTCHDLESLSEGHGMACVESNMATLCKSNGKDTIQILSGMAWERHCMCELALQVVNISFIIKLPLEICFNCEYVYQAGAGNLSLLQNINSSPGAHMHWVLNALSLG